MGVDAREPQTSVKTARDLSNCEVVTEVTPGMILQDLAMGLDKDDIAAKYAYKNETGTLCEFERWMVDEMFKDPLLKGKRPAKVKVLPFKFKASSEEAGILDIESVQGRVKRQLAEAGYTEVEETKETEEDVLQTPEGLNEIQDGDFDVDNL
jgi:hypothetical protein